MKQISKMYIDDVEVTPTSAYTFTTLGEHIVKCEFCNLSSCYKMFNNCYGLTSVDLSNFNTSKVTNMNYMFSSCSGLTSLDLSSFDTSNVTTMLYMFSRCSGLTSLTMLGDISKVTSYSSMFYNITTTGTLTYNCAYEDAWTNILVTKQSTSKFPSTWTKTCITV